MLSVQYKAEPSRSGVVGRLVSGHGGSMGSMNHDGLPHAVFVVVFSSCLFLFISSLFSCLRS